MDPPRAVPSSFILASIIWLRNSFGRVIVLNRSAPASPDWVKITRSP